MKHRLMIAGLIVLLLLGVPYAFVFLRSRHLHKVMQELSAIQIGRIRIQGFRATLSKASIGMPVIEAGSHVSSVVWTADTGMLHMLRFAPLTAVEANINFKDGVASEVVVWTESHAFGDSLPGAT